VLVISVSVGVRVGHSRLLLDDSVLDDLVTPPVVVLPVEDKGAVKLTAVVAKVGPLIRHLTLVVDNNRVLNVSEGHTSREEADGELDVLSGAEAVVVAPVSTHSLLDSVLLAGRDGDISVGVLELVVVEVLGAESVDIRVTKTGDLNSTAIDGGELVLVDVTVKSSEVLVLADDDLGLGDGVEPELSNAPEEVEDERRVDNDNVTHTLGVVSLIVLGDKLSELHSSTVAHGEALEVHDRSEALDSTRRKTTSDGSLTATTDLVLLTPDVSHKDLVISELGHQGRAVDHTGTLDVDRVTFLVETRESAGNELNESLNHGGMSSRILGDVELSIPLL